MDPWLVAIIVYFALSGFTFVPSLRALFIKVDPKTVASSAEKAGKEFDRSAHFNEAQKDILKQHFERLSGTLVFWKNEAMKYKQLHYYCLIWTIPSAVLIPILAQAISDNTWSKALVTAVFTTVHFFSAK